MLSLCTRLVAAVVFAAAAARAADIHGTVVVERRLTKRNVTPTSGLYQRGSAVGLGKDETANPLAYERTHVVVYLEGTALAGAAQTAKPAAAIEQRDRRFVPDLVVIPAGASVAFPNFDPVFHNVFSLSKPKEFDLGNYRKGESRSVTFGKAGIVYVYCHLHPNMTASVVVTPNAWNTIPDEAGHFDLTGIPPGKYTILAWHKTAGFFRQNITVTDNGSSDIRFLVPLPAEPEGLEKSGEHGDHSIAKR